jgi:hypothetical protein
MNVPGLHRTLATVASALALLGAGGAEAAFRAYVSSTGLDTDLQGNVSRAQQKV